MVIFVKMNPKFRLHYQICLYFMVIVSCQFVLSTSTPQHLFLCKNYTDTRILFTGNEFNITEIIEEATQERSDVFIPNNFMSTGINQTFDLKKSSREMKCSDDLRTIKATLNLNDPTVPGPPSKFKPKKLRGKIGPHFSPEGYIEYDHFYYYRDNFCLSSISEDAIEVEICPVDCSQPGNLCLPKCCGAGEVLVYWNFTCVKTPQHWTPFLYDDVYTRLSNDKQKSIQIHYSRPYLNCTGPPAGPHNSTQWAWFPWAFSDVKRPRKVSLPPDAGLMLRVLKDGSIMHLGPSRRWSSISEGLYCIDGFANWGLGGNGSYLRDEDHQVVLRCPSPSEMAKALTETNDWIDDVYAGVLYLASVFILLTAIVHALLCDRQNIHGLTVLSQCVSLFFFYVSHGTVCIMAQRRDPVGDNRSWQCLSTAILSHFFFLTTFAWLTVVNFDLWLTFRSMRPISKMSKKMRRFRLYSFMGWGLPFILIAGFVYLDFHYRDFRTEVIVPDYGITSCYVASWARRQYICSILTAIILINVILIVSTFKIFYDFEKGANIMPKRAKGDKYSFKLFIKLFLVMGTIWSFDAIFCWFYNNGEQSPWYIMVIDCFMFLQAIAIFIILCCNRRTMKQLEDKYPFFKSENLQATARYSCIPAKSLEYEKYITDYFPRRIHPSKKNTQDSRNHNRRHHDGHDPCDSGNVEQKTVDNFDQLRHDLEEGRDLGEEEGVRNTLSGIDRDGGTVAKLMHAQNQTIVN